MEKEKRKQIIWAVILTSAIILFFATGCKPKQIVTEKVVTKVDSSAIISLQQQVSARNILIEIMNADLQTIREENVRLQGEVSKHEINYDTAAPLKPDGTYPKASETITESRTTIEKKIEEFETLKQEYRREAESLTSKNEYLELTIKTLREENRDLKEKNYSNNRIQFSLVFLGSWSWCIVIFCTFDNTKTSAINTKKLYSF